MSETTEGEGMNNDVVTVTPELEHCPRCKREYDKAEGRPVWLWSADGKRILHVCLHCVADWIKANVPEIVDGPAPKEG